MPKIIMEFNLPEELSEAKIAAHAGDFFTNLIDINEHCRRVIKYGNESEDYQLACEHVRDLITPLIYEIG